MFQVSGPTELIALCRFGVLGRLLALAGGTDRTFVHDVIGGDRNPPYTISGYAPWDVLALTPRAKDKMPVCRHGIRA